MITMEELLALLVRQGGSDLHISLNSPPRIRVDGMLLPVDCPPLSPEDTRRLATSVLTSDQIAKLDRELELDCSFGLADQGRFRANVFFQQGSVAAVMRLIPTKIATFDQLGLSKAVCERICALRSGLVLVTGATGSGKSTSLASMIHHINSTRQGHIVTIEDPLEFVHKDQLSYLSQRELGIDTKDFGHALRAMLRQAPDVILIGEMRDPDTMSIAMQAGETGHLVFSTVHTSSAYETMDRIVNMFPPHEKGHLCQRLSGALRSVISQKLVPRADGNGRVAVNEILICTPTVSKLIEDGHFSDLYHAMNEGTFWGMQTMNQGLVRFVKAGVITEEHALQYSSISSELKQMLRR